MKINKQKLTVATVVAISLSSFTALQADENPFNLKPVSKSTSDMRKLAMGMCGGNMEGMRGGNMEGMCGGNMPHGISPTMLPESESIGAKAVTEYCTQCHALPGPKQHTADVWPTVVGRMLGHIAVRNKSMPNNLNAKQIIEYLQRHSDKSK